MRGRGKRLLYAWALVLLVGVMAVIPRPAYAANDILLGTFFTTARR